MIIGIGTDLVDSRRIETVLKRHGARFINRCFDISERKFTATDPAAPLFYAKRFAAKEAAAKALGTGITDGVFLRDFVVSNDTRGMPRLALQNGARRQLDQRLGQGFPGLHLSISDDTPYAMAFVVIERLSENPASR